MPEGPEIRRAADQISAALLNRPLQKVFFDKDSFPMLSRRAKQLVGQHVLRVDTHGKAMLTRLSGGQTIYSHNQLYGRWYICARGTLPQTKRSLRLALHTAKHSALLYSASEIDVLGPNELDQHPFLSRLGPDILAENLTWQKLRDRAGSIEFRRRSLAALYVDQHFVAGSGDYLRSEILFAARANPWSKPGELSKNVISRLSRQTLAIARRSYRTGGITNPSGLAARLRAELASSQKRSCQRTDGQRFGETQQSIDKEAYRFAVFRRQHKPCYRCGSTIKRAETSGRALYYCPACQSVES